MIRIGGDSNRSLPPTGAAEVKGLQVPGLRNGASLIFRALSQSPDGRWTVLVNGVSLEAKVSASLKPGFLYSARAERLPDRPAWVLHLLGPAGEGRVADFLRASGLPGDQAAIMALRALMAENLPLDPRQLARLRAALLKAGVSEDRAAILARALAKGLDPEAFLNALDPTDSGGGSPSGGRQEGGDGAGDGAGDEQRGRGNEDGGKTGNESGRRGGEEYEADPGRSPEAVPAVSWRELETPDTEDPKGTGVLAGLLRRLAGRTGDLSNPYQLFNSRSGPRGRWIYAPYRFEREGVAFSGTLRILIPEGGLASSVLSADVRVEDEGKRESRYEFSLRGEGTGLVLGLSARDAEGEERLSRSLGDLERSLGDLGCRVDRSTGGPSPGTGAGYRAVDDHA